MNLDNEELHRQYLKARFTDFERIAQGDLPMDYGPGEMLPPNMALAKEARIVRRTLEQEIDDEISYLTDKLAKKQKLKQLLIENPAIAEFMNLSRS